MLLHLIVIALSLVKCQCMNIFDNPDAIAASASQSLPQFSRVAQPINTIASPIVFNQGLPLYGASGFSNPYVSSPYEINSSPYDINASPYDLNSSPYASADPYNFNPEFVGQDVISGNGGLGIGGRQPRQRGRDRSGARTRGGRGSPSAIGLNGAPAFTDNSLGVVPSRAIGGGRGIGSGRSIGGIRSVGGGRALGGGRSSGNARALGASRASGSGRGGGLGSRRPVREGGIASGVGQRRSGRDGRDRIQQRLSSFREGGFVENVRSVQEQNQDLLGQLRNRNRERIILRRRNGSNKLDESPEAVINEQELFDFSQTQPQSADYQPIEASATVVEHTNSADEVSQLADALGLRVDQVQHVLHTKPTVDVTSVINKRSN